MSLSPTRQRELLKFVEDRSRDYAQSNSDIAAYRDLVVLLRDMPAPAEPSAMRQEKAGSISVEDLRPLVSMTFDEARAADARGERTLYCEFDAHNPCWSQDRGWGVVGEGKHWGGADACAQCTLRAMIAGRPHAS